MLNRRTVLQGLIAVQIGGATRWLTPAAAAAETAPLRRFSADEAALLGSFAGTLVLGAEMQGVVHYIDHHATVPAAESLLALRYLDIAPPYADFYRSGLKALAAASWNTLSEADRQALIGAMQQGAVPGWQGPPPPLFYFAVRSDAIDVVYGTEAGFAALDVPYLAHIPPSRPW